MPTQPLWSQRLFKDELLGAPHNLIRHPDMPEAAYADF